MLLNSQLLKFNELRAAGLQIEAATRLVDPAVLTRTHIKRHEAERVYLSKITKIVVRREKKFLETWV
jgi:hypothetical protein